MRGRGVVTAVYLVVIQIKILCDPNNNSYNFSRVYCVQVLYLVLQIMIWFDPLNKPYVTDKDSSLSEVKLVQVNSTQKQSRKQLAFGGQQPIPALLTMTTYPSPPEVVYDQKRRCILCLTCKRGSDQLFCLIAA